MAIRKLQMDYEAVYGVAAADGTQVALPASKFTPGRKQNRNHPRVITGTRWAFNETRRVNAEATWTLEMPLYYAMSVYPLALHFGTPVTTTVFTSAKKHVFKPGGSTILSGTFQYMRQSSANAGEWYQMTGCVADKLSIKQNNKGIPICTFSGFGKYPTNISAPSTIATLAIEAYVHPDLAQLTVTKAGSTWNRMTDFNLDSMQGFEPQWTLGSGVSLSRIMLGDASATIKATAMQDDYTGSLVEVNDGSGLIASTGLIVTYTGTDVIGTAGVPSATIKMPKPYTSDANESDSDSDDEEEFSVDGAYDSSSGSGIAIELVDMLAATVFAGH